MQSLPRSFKAQHAWNIARIVLVLSGLMCCGACTQDADELHKSHSKPQPEHEQITEQHEQINVEREKTTVPPNRFQGKTTEEKLNFIATEIRTLWGDGDGFFYVASSQTPFGKAESEVNAEPTASTESGSPSADSEATLQAKALSLNLRWLIIQQKVSPLLRDAFQIEGNLCCIFSADGDFLCNNPVYELCICRAQGRPDRATMIQDSSPSVARYAPTLKPEFRRESRFSQHGQADFARVREALLTIRSEGSSIMDPGWQPQAKPAEDSGVDCEVCTQWRSVIPPEMPAGHDFEYRIQFLFREAINTTNTEFWSVSSGEKRLEFLNTVQFRKTETEEYPPSGWVTVAPVSYDPSTIMHFNRFARLLRRSEAFTDEVLAQPERFRTCSAWPGLEVAVVRTDWLMAEIQKVQEQLIGSIADPPQQEFP